jgi:hypothetical protein
MKFVFAFSGTLSLFAAGVLLGQPAQAQFTTPDCSATSCALKDTVARCISGGIARGRWTESQVKNWCGWHQPRCGKARK